MNTNTITLAAFAAACLAGSTAYAGPVAPPDKKVIEAAPESCITGDIGFDVVSEYIHQGIVKQNQGFIIQPYADLHFRIFKGAGALTSITVDVGIWDSFQSNHPQAGPFGGNRFALAGRGASTPNWFESDFVSGLTFSFNKLNVSPYFKVYESPASAFPNVYTSGINIVYDDSAALGVIALRPHARVELQFEGTTGNDFSANPAFHGRGQYYEVGISPGHSWGPFTLSLPVNAGFGSGGYYLGNRGFGFISAGVATNVALNFVPACLGKWSISSGFSYYRLGGNNTAPNLSGASGFSPAQGTPGVTGADKNQLVFQGGLKVAF
jgi:hypothetical protein